MSMVRFSARGLLPPVLAASLSVAAAADHRPLTEVSLLAGPDETNPRIAASKEGVHLGQTRLEPWPFAVPSCNGCNLTLERSFSPVGPDRTLLLTAPDATQPAWFFAERLRLPASLPGGATLRESAASGLMIEADSTRTPLSPGETVHVTGCEYHLIWYEPQANATTGSNAEPPPAPGAAAKPQPAIVAEDPTVKVQVQGACS